MHIKNLIQNLFNFVDPVAFNSPTFKVCNESVIENGAMMLDGMRVYVDASKLQLSEIS